MSRGQRCKHAGPSEKITGGEADYKREQRKGARGREMGEELKCPGPRWVGWGPRMVLLEQRLV